MSNNKSEIDRDLNPDEADDIQNIKTQRKAFSKLAVELNEEDLKSQGVQKLLLAEISRLEDSAQKLEVFQEKYYESSKECAVLKEKGKSLVFSEILYSITLSIGATLLGLTPSIKSEIIPSYVIGIIGGVLILGAIIAKVVKK